MQRDVQGNAPYNLVSPAIAMESCLAGLIIISISRDPAKDGLDSSRPSDWSVINGKID